jgi:hypothetical protein
MQFNDPVGLAVVGSNSLIAVVLLLGFADTRPESFICARIDFHVYVLEFECDFFIDEDSLLSNEV